MSYIEPLNVCMPNGRRVEAKITQMGKNIRVQVDSLDVVKKDDASFAKDGVISFTVERVKYAETIVKLEKYLEDLFLKGMADEDLHRSLGIKSKSGRTKRTRSKGKIRRASGKGNFPSVHSGSRGGESPKSNWERNPSTKMAESSNSNSGEQDTERN